jgi:hypothetical protein
MPLVLSLEEQITSMKTTWPALVPRHVDRRLQLGRFIGKLRPQYCWYTIEIRYQGGTPPEVRVLAPTLVRLPGNKEGELPHVYPPANDPTLCLFDPRTGEWKASMELAYSTVPWTLDWLSCYEHWLMTGRWTGGGRHAGDAIPISSETLQ